MKVAELHFTILDLDGKGVVERREERKTCSMEVLQFLWLHNRAQGACSIREPPADSIPSVIAQSHHRH